MLTTTTSHIYILNTLYIICRYMGGDTPLYYYCFITYIETICFAFKKKTHNQFNRRDFSRIRLYNNNNNNNMYPMRNYYERTILNSYISASSIVCSSINIFQIAKGGRVCEIFFSKGTHTHIYIYTYRQCRFAQTGELNIKTLRGALWRCTPPGSCGREKRKRIEFPRS